MQKIIGRENEMEELERLYGSGKPEFVAVYGRRRVGKTYLVMQMFRNRMTFYHSGLSPYDKEHKVTMRDQLSAFYASLMDFGLPETQCPRTWQEAFQKLKQLLEQKNPEERQVIFIDELPWMDTPRSKFLVAFEHFWNSWAAWHDNIMLIVCGSATSWMLDNLINNHGGLYDRLTSSIKLSPFTLKECKELFESRGFAMSDYDIAECYMIFGGIPYYLELFQRGKSLAQNVDQLFFKPNAKLKGEYDRLFGSLFNNPEIYKQIVRQLASRRSGYNREEIARFSGITSGGTLSKILDTLVASDFITQYIPFGGKKTDIYYRTTDCFCLFCLQYDSMQNGNDALFWEHNQNKPQINTWRGLTFELLCFNHSAQIKKALDIYGVASKESAWIVKGNKEEKGVQIDMIIDRDDRVVNLCEMKFLSAEYAPSQTDESLLRARISALQEHLSLKQTIHLTLVTTVGLKQTAHSGIIQKVVTLHDLLL